SAKNCRRLASTRNGKANTATRRGPRWRSSPARSPRRRSPQMEIVQTGEALPASSFASGAARIEGWLGRIVEVPVALLTAIEVLILLAGVISRYVFHRPFTWSDELASILFLWLAMLGAVVAFRRGEHMRMSTLV